MNIRISADIAPDHKNVQSKIAQKVNKTGRTRRKGESLYTFSPQILWIKKAENRVIHRVIHIIHISGCGQSGLQRCFSERTFCVL